MPLVIRPEHVGQTLGLFVAVECKREGWGYDINRGGTQGQREAAQMRFLKIVHGHGGLALFASDAEQFVSRWRML